MRVAIQNTVLVLLAASCFVSVVLCGSVFVDGSYLPWLVLSFSVFIACLITVCCSEFDED